MQDLGNIQTLQDLENAFKSIQAGYTVPTEDIENYAMIVAQNVIVLESFYTKFDDYTVLVHQKYEKLAYRL